MGSPKDFSSPKTYREIESDLIGVCRWAIASIRILGHFPYTITRQSSTDFQYNKNSFRLTLNRLSWPIVYSFILLLIFILWLLNYYLRLRSKLRFNKLFGPTESMAYEFMIINTSIARVHLLLRSLVYAKRNLQFWQANCTLLHNFKESGYNIKGKCFQKLRRETCCIFVICTLVIIAQTIYCHIYTAIQGSIKYNTLLKRKSFWPMFPDSEERLGSGLFWTSIIYLRVSSCWQIFFLRMYTLLFQQISKDSSFYRPEIYLTELGYTVKGADDAKISIIRRIVQRTKVNPSFNLNTNVLKSHHLQNSRIDINLKLFVEIRKMTRKFNKTYGMEIIWDISVVANVTIYYFFAWFWISRGNVQVINDVALPMILYTGKIILLGWLSGKLQASSQGVAPAIMRDLEMQQMNKETQRKVTTLHTFD